MSLAVPGTRRHEQQNMISINEIVQNETSLPKTSDSDKWTLFHRENLQWHAKNYTTIQSPRLFIFPSFFFLNYVFKTFFFILMMTSDI